MKKNKVFGIGLTVFILAVLVILTIVIVINVFVFSSQNTSANTTICITANAPAFEPNLTSEEVLSNIENSENENSSSSSSGGLTVYDTNQAWTTKTQLNIFEIDDPAVKYDGTGTSHVIAPGTSNDYIFCLQNDRDFNVKYTLEISGGNDTNYDLPVMIQISDSDGNMLTNWVPIGELHSITDRNSLEKYADRQYIIRWKWEYEDGTESTDEYDTLLGNLATLEEIGCRIDINVTSEYFTPQESSGENSESSGVTTGDKSNAMIYIVPALCAVVTVLAVLLVKKRKKENE